MFDLDALDADEIIPNLWQGSQPPTGTVIGNQGFDLLILCAIEYQPEAFDFPGVEIFHAPNDDHHHRPLNREKLSLAIKAARLAADRVRQGQKVLITCMAGMNRSGLVTALTMHFLNKWPGEECIQIIRTKRRWGPGGYVPLSNDDFIRALKHLPRSALANFLAT